MRIFLLSVTLVITCIVMASAASDELRIVRAEPQIDTKLNGEVSTKLFLSDGTNMIVPLVRVKGIKVLKAPDGTPYVLLSGATCTECDMNDSIYLVPRGVKGSGNDLPRYSYPGTLKTYDADELVEKSRMFYGHCFSKEKNVVVWFSEYLGTDRKWHKINSLLRLENEGPVFSELSEPGGNIKNVLKRAKSGACKELRGIDGHTEP